MSELLRPLVAILADGHFHSGSELGAALGISRAGVWKYIAKVADLGLEVHSVRGKGYRLAERVSLLDPALIRRELDALTSDRLHHLEVLEITDSTNTHAMRALQDGALKPQTGGFAVYLAERQTSGKGRRGRQWVSQYGRHIAMTLVKQVDAGASGTDGMSLVVGLGVIRALHALGITQAGVKWPNDIVCDGKKLAGILMEITGDVTGLCQLLIGIGINTRCDDKAMTAVAQPWTDLYRLTGELSDRNVLAATLIRHIMAVMATYENDGMGAFLAEWQQVDAMYGKQVVLTTGNHQRMGRASGIAENGALVLETDHGLELVSGGEISLRETAS